MTLTLNLLLTLSVQGLKARFVGWLKVIETQIPTTYMWLIYFAVIYSFI